MIRIDGRRVTDKRRIAVATTLAASLLTAAISAGHGSDAEPPREKEDRASADILLNHLIQTRRTILEERPEGISLLMPLIPPAVDPEQTTCFSDLPEDVPEPDRIRDATLMLVATYDHPRSGIRPVFGSGTIIEAQDGINKVLTVGHVVSPEIIFSDGEEGQLRAIYAFDHTGAILAELAPSYHLTKPFNNVDHKADNIHDEVAVLAPVMFPSHEKALNWQMRGLPLASDPANHVILATGESGKMSVTPGHSGAAMLNAQGEVIGVISAYLPFNYSAIAADTPMRENLFNTELEFILGPDRQAITSVLMETWKPSFHEDGIVIAAPISSPAAIWALGLNAADISVSSDAGHHDMLTLGYPNAECRSTSLRLLDSRHLRYEETPDLLVQADTGPVFVMSDQGYPTVLEPEGLAAKTPERGLSSIMQAAERVFEW